MTGIAIVSNQEFIYANTYARRLLGYETVETFNWSEIIHPDDYIIFESSLDLAFQQNRAIQPMLQKLIKKDGDIIPVWISFTPYNKNEGNYVQLHFHHVDNNIENEHYYWLLSENISDIVTEIGLDGTIHYISPSVIHILNYEPHEIIGKQLVEFVHPEDFQIVINAQKKLLATNISSNYVRYRLKHKENHYVWVESKANIFVYKYGEQRVVVDTREITNQIKAESMLRQSEKLAVIGELSAGVVHEIKNPLTTIKGFLKLMEAGTIKTKDYISILNKEIESIEKIAEDLLAFAKPNKEEFTIVVVQEVIDEVLFLFNNRTDDKMLQFKWSKPRKCLYIWGEKVQIKQVILNLIKNAMEACSLEGIIEINLYPQAKEVVIEVIDNGCGIAPDKLKEIGTSFYTSKEKGTGLGLMVSQKIISSHKGKILAESTVDKGSTFTVVLPLYELDID